MRTRLLVSTGLLGALAWSTPAHAEEPPRKDEVNAVLAGLAPPMTMVGLVAVAALVRRPEFSAFIPLGTGAGHLVAGEGMKGAMIGLGSYGVLLAGGGLGFLVENTLFPPSAMNIGPQGWTGMILGSTTALLMYTGWASWDAYHAAERRNQAELREIETGMPNLPYSGYNN